MSHLDTELNQLKDELLDMIALVRSQLIKSKKALINYDPDLAKEVVANDKRVNGTELRIDKDCESILALYNPVAIDLRFVLASLKINNNLERIGDNADGIAKLIINTDTRIDPEILTAFDTDEMYNNAVGMLNDVYEAFLNEDTRLARQVFKKDDFLNENNAMATNIAPEIIQKKSEKIPQILAVISVIRKLERVGDLTKNIAEEIIFHIEAKVLKHKKQQATDSK